MNIKKSFDQGPLPMKEVVPLRQVISLKSQFDPRINPINQLSQLLILGFLQASLKKINR